MMMKKYNLKINKIIIATIIITISLFCYTSAQNKINQQKISTMIDSLSLEQKAKLLIGTGSFFVLPDSLKDKFPPPPPRDSLDSDYENMVKKIRKYLPGAAGFTAEYPEYGITTQVLADGPAGLRISPYRKGETRKYYCTAFPISTLLASTWDTELVYDVGQAMGNEVLEYNADVLLAPGMNLQRDLLCGRNFEYYSEDPLITGKMAAAFVKGIQSNGVGTALKHFAVNNQETSRMSVNAIVSTRALREIYLKGFEIAVTEAQPWCVMSSYNKINGQYASQSHDLLTKILREDWGFKGYVMNDWGAGNDIVAQMKAGNDVIMPGDVSHIKTLIEAVQTGILDEEILDRNLSHMLNIMLNSPKQKAFNASNNPNLDAHADIARRAASEGMVLLKNNSKTLPISSNIKQVALFGNTSYEFISGGTGSGDVNEAYTISLLEGLKNAGLSADSELTDIYHEYIEEMRSKLDKKKYWWANLFGVKIPVDEMPVKPELAAKMAVKSEMALITIGRNSGEGTDRKPEEGDFYLTETEKNMIKYVSNIFHEAGKSAIVILNIGGVIETATWRDLPDAILCAWQPGQEAGNSVADVLTGKVNPSGKLAISFPIKYSEAPTAKNFPGTAVDPNETYDPTKTSSFSFTAPRVPWQVIYEEDIYVGYRYYDTFKVPVAYEFGYGLSYSDFEFSNLHINKSDFVDSIIVSIEIKNTGSVAGREVAQLYVSAPKVKIEKPKNELKSFTKSKILQPGETETIQLILTAKDIASFDEKSSSWIVEAGSYKINLDRSSKNFLQSDSFRVKENMTASIVNKALIPDQKIEKLYKND